MVFSSHGALAGIQGVVAVSLKVHGLPYSGPDEHGEVELHGLPVKGSVRLRRNALLSLDMTWERLKHILSLLAHNS